MCSESGFGATRSGAPDGWMEPEKWWSVEALDMFLFGAKEGGSKDEVDDEEHGWVVLVTILVYSPFFIFEDLYYIIITLY